MQLTRREKQVVVVAGLALLAFAAYQLVARPGLRRAESLARSLQRKRKELEQLRARSAEYEELRARLMRIREKIAAQAEDFGMLSHLETVSKELDLSGKVAYMNPSRAPVGEEYEETTVEMKLEGVTLEQVSRFLLQLQAEKGVVGVKSFRVERRRDGLLLDTIVQVTNLHPVEGA